MFMEILTGIGGILSYLQDILGGFCPRQQKRVGGILSGGDFVLHSICTVTAKLISAIVSTYADCWFSHVAAQICIMTKVIGDIT